VHCTCSVCERVVLRDTGMDTDHRVITRLSQVHIDILIMILIHLSIKTIDDKNYRVTSTLDHRRSRLIEAER
jgi:hypothetical protein